VLVHAAPDPSASSSSSSSNSSSRHISSKRAGRLLSRVRRGTVADVDVKARTVDVIYDDEEDEGDEGGGGEEGGGGGEEEDEEEDGVGMSRVVPLAGSGMAQVEQGRLLLNCSRAYLKSPLGRLHEALRSASFAAAVLDGVVVVVVVVGGAGCRNGGEEEEEEEEGEEGAGASAALKLLLSAYEVRVGALCRGGFFAAAKDDVRRVARLPKRVLSVGGKGKAAVGEWVKRMWEGIEQAGVLRQRENRRLVKEMSAWLNTAMGAGVGAVGAGEGREGEGGGGGGVGAIAAGIRPAQGEEGGCACM
jgi:hypothetical protein